MDRSLPMRGRKRPNSPHPAIIPESSRFGLVALAVTLLFLWAALTSQTILRLHHSNHTRLRSGGLSFVRPAPRAFFRPDRQIAQPPRAGPVKAGRVFRGHPQGLALIGASTVASLIGSGLEALATS